MKCITKPHIFLEQTLANIFKMHLTHVAKHIYGCKYRHFDSFLTHMQLAHTINMKLNIYIGSQN
jgi:hypothetical protein